MFNSRVCAFLSGSCLIIAADGFHSGEGWVLIPALFSVVMALGSLHRFNPSRNPNGGK